MTAEKESTEAPSEPLYARESAEPPAFGPSRGAGVASGPQTGAEGFEPPTPARRGPIDYAREHAAAGEAAKADLRQQYAEALWPLTDWDGDRLNAEAAADAVLAVRDRELEQLRAAIARAHQVADLIAAGAPWTASRADTARRIREALDPQEQP